MSEQQGKPVDESLGKQQGKPVDESLGKQLGKILEEHLGDQLTDLLSGQSEEPKVRSPLPSAELRIAIPRGNLFDGSLDLLAKVGFDVSELRSNDRKLVFEVGPGRRVIATRPSDVPTYVEYGAADVGIAGKDVLLEHRRNIYELLDLRYGECRIVYAAPAERHPEDEELRHLGMMRIATKYPAIARQYFEGLGRQVEVIELRGSMELAPQVDLADGIVDVTATGITLRENNLVERGEIAASSARLIANRVSHKLKANMIDELVRRLRELTS